jgi:hypothetical protein
MRKFALILAISSLLALSSCGAPKEIDGNTYPTHGYFNEDTSKSKNVCYEVSVGNIVWSIILIETIVMPIYFIGWSLFNPVSKKGADGVCGIDALVDRKNA